MQLDLFEKSEENPNRLCSGKTSRGFYSLFTKDNAFGCFLAGLLRSDILHSGTENGSWPAAGWASCDGIHVAWRVLDAQYFGVAQRRKRVFVIASARKMDTRDVGLPQKVLFESPCLRRDTGESQEKQSDFTTFTENHFRQYVQKDQVNTLNTNRQGLEGIIAFPLDSFTGYKEGGISGTLKAGTGTIHGGGESLIAYSQKDTRCTNYQEDQKSPTLKSANSIARGNNEVLILEAQGGNIIRVRKNIIPTLTTQIRSHPPMVLNKPVAFNFRGFGFEKKGYITNNKAYSVLNSNVNYVLPQDHLKLRKLTPRECERLQGFPDDYTKIPYRGRPIEECPDGPRYRAIGNSWAVPVIRWLGRRIEKVLNNET